MRISDWSSDVCSSDLTDDIAAYATAKVKLAATFGRNADAPVSIRFQGRTYDNLSARATIAHSRYRQSVHLAYDYAIRSEEHTSELQSLMRISYAVFCLKKKKKKNKNNIDKTKIIKYNTLQDKRNNSGN